MEWDEKDQVAVGQKFAAMNLCGCGNPETTLRIIHDLLNRAADHDKNGSFYDGADGASCEWVEFGAKVLDSWGLTDHSTGIGWAWLTDPGRLLLRFFEEFGYDDEKWTEWMVRF